MSLDVSPEHDMNVKMMPATESDIEFMLEIDKLFFKDYVIALDGAFDDGRWRGYLQCDLPRAFVLAHGERQIGYYRYSVVETGDVPYVYLRVIAVLPEEQGRGYRRMMYEHFKARVRNAGFSDIKLRCPHTSDAIDCYLRLGYRALGDEPRARLFVKEMG